MRSVVFVGELPPAIQAWLDERHRLGQDDFDEVWEGDRYVPPPLSGRHARVAYELPLILRPYADRAGLVSAGHCAIGTDEDYRVPDMVLFRARGPSMDDALPAVVVEVTLPNDRSRLKSDFYHRQGVEEVLIVDPERRSVEWLVRGAEAFEPAGESTLLGLSATALADLIDWPA